MLTNEEKKQIDEEIEKLPKRSAACIEALKAVQDHRGWVSDESVRDIAEYLGMSTEQVDSVATFYSLIFRKPVGRNVILLCDSISCWILGYEEVYEKLRSTLGISWGETTSDKRFTLLPIPCLGTCDRAPALMINHDLHRNLTPDKLEEILKNYE